MMIEIRRKKSQRKSHKIRTLGTWSLYLNRDYEAYSCYSFVGEAVQKYDFD